MQPCVRGESARCSFNDSLAIVDFLYTFGAICDIPAMGLHELYTAVCRPLEGPTLRKFYLQLLKVAFPGLVRHILMVMIIC